MFDWQTEDSVWNDEIAEVAPNNRVPGNWRALVLLGLLAVAAALAASLAIGRRIDEATDQVRKDLLSSFYLVQDSARSRDGDLFYSLLSGRDLAWTETQKQLLATGRFLDRPGFGLFHVEANGTEQVELYPTEGLTVTLSPDLSSAEIVALQNFRTDEIGAFGSVALAQTTVFRRGQQRWLLAPPDEEFWGPQLDRSFGQLKVNFPKRDEAIVDRLGPLLADDLTRICRQLVDVDCRSGMRVELTLSTSPANLLENRRQSFRSSAISRVKLETATPTLVGIPVNEAGYQVLTRGYARQLATAMIAAELRAPCCSGNPFQNALATYQLHQLGLGSWPVTAADHARLLVSDPDPQALANFWDQARPVDTSNAAGSQVNLLVDFLLHADLYV